MNLRTRYLLFGAVFLLGLFTSSCSVVKPYQRVYLNDENMILAKRAIDGFDTNFHSYREGAAGANGGKSGGGCGCN